MKLDYHLHELQPYINWTYFYHAWQLRQPGEQQRIRQEAEQMLGEIDDRYQAHAVFLITPAHSDGDDIIIGANASERWSRDIPTLGGVGSYCLPMLRQQTGEPPFLCIADFIPSIMHDSHYSQIGLFATSVDRGMEEDFDDDPYKKMMAQLLADRMAEAAAERMHEEVRKTYWGYAPTEALTMDELHQERFQGIRPAVGYPSLPDASLNFLLDEILDFSRIGITLTENGAMRPHASVSGLMISHPQARYFTVGKIGSDQLNDYARRRGITLDKARKFLSANI